MELDRRAFMKALAAACGMAALPSWAEAVAQVPDPPPAASNLVDPVERLSNWVVQVSIGGKPIAYLKASQLQVVDDRGPKYEEYGGVLYPVCSPETRQLYIYGSGSPHDDCFSELRKEVLNGCLGYDLRTVTLSVYQEYSDSPFLDPLFTIEGAVPCSLSFDAVNVLSTGDVGDLHYSATFILNDSSKLLPWT